MFFLKIFSDKESHLFHCICMCVFTLCIIACNPQKSTLSLIIVQKCKRQQTLTHAPKEWHKRKNKGKPKQQTLYNAFRMLHMIWMGSHIQQLYTRISDKMKRRKHTWKYWFWKRRYSQFMAVHRYSLLLHEHQTNFYLGQKLNDFWYNILYSMDHVSRLYFAPEGETKRFKKYCFETRCARISWLGYVPINCRCDVFWCFDWDAY